jgi:type IV fimbrial biogenesis protein FimT
MLVNAAARPVAWPGPGSGPGFGPGFGLIELMIAVAIFAILVLLAAPIYAQWVANTRVRNVAETIQNGLRLARTEAVQGGQPARFELTAGAGWTVCVPRGDTPGSCAAAQSTNQEFKPGDAAARVVVGGTTQSTMTLNTDVSGQPQIGGGVTFNALGRVQSGTNALAKIDVSSTGSSARRLVIVVAAGGSVRQCDPALKRSEHPQGCES